jgi:hypothetical protein
VAVVTLLLPTAGGAASLWDHNGSVVSLEATGNIRKFYYKVPRSNLPATEGALLFEGERVGNSFIGTAYVFSTKCDPRGYAVRGFVTNNDQKIVMRGKAPLVDANCVVNGYRDDVLVFTYLRKEVDSSPGYDKSWFISEFWSGEYPPGFSVTKRHTVLMARTGMAKALPRNVACEMPFLAVIHPWNTARIRESKVTFLSASKIVNMVAKEDFVFRPDEVSAVPINIKKGEVLEYLRNIGEGAFEVRIRGTRYRADQDLFGHVLDVPGQDFIEENWVALNCVNGKRAFIYLPDLGLNGTKTRVSGINDIGPGLIKYGKARDLTLREAERLERSNRR